MKIERLRVQHMANPIGFYMPEPVFTFVVSDGKGTGLSSGRLMVATDPEFKAVVFDSGETPDLSPLGYCPKNLQLKSRTRYFYKVWAQSDKGDEAWSETSWFETGKMKEKWQAEWITCRLDNPRLPIFTTSFDLPSKAESARLYITGLGLYEARLNGKKAGDEYLTPYCNNYHRWIQVQTFDVTRLMQKHNTIRVELGDGWYKGRFGFDPKKPSGYYGKRFLLRAELRVRLQDGTEKVIGTDTGWDVERSIRTFSNIYDGERVDETLPEAAPEKAQLYIPGKDEKDPSSLAMDRISLPVKVQKEFRKAEVIHTPAGETVLDIGQEISGIFSLKVREKRGTKVRLQFGEILQDGNFFNLNLRSAKAEYDLVCDGTEHTVSPKFTFYGYRYVKLEGLDHYRDGDFTALAIYSDLEKIGSMKTGNAKINRLLSNIQWGQMDNFVDVPTDCPQRDERMGWTGDAEVFCPTASLWRETYAFYRKYMHDMYTEQQENDGKVPHVVPSFGITKCAGVEYCACAWSDAATIIPWKVYEAYGDPSFLKENYASMKAWTDAVEKMEENDHEWEKQFHFGDWLALDGPYPYPSPLGATDTGFLAEAYFYYSASLTASAANVLGKRREEAHYRALSQKVLKYIQHEYYSPAGRCCVDTQTGYVVTLWLGLWPDPEMAVKGLRRKFKESGGKLKTGFIGTPQLLLILSKYGMTDIAYNILFNEERPGWLYEVNMGATTIWERWNSVLEDGHLSDLTMNSLNHYAYGSVAEWIYRVGAGLNQAPGSVGWKKVEFAPAVDQRMKSMEASYQSASGLWKAGWKLQGKTVTVTLTVPFGCTAHITLPDAKEEAYVSDGRRIAKNHEVGQGSYTFTYQREIHESATL